MPVPSTRADLSTTAASNSPAGSDAIGTNADDYLRAHAKCIADNYADIQLKAPKASPVFTGLVSFADAGTTEYSVTWTVAGNGNAWKSTDGTGVAAHFWNGGTAYYGTLTNHSIAISTNNVARLTIDNAGDATFSGSVTSPDFVETSTRELKSDIVSVEAGALDRIQALDVKEYKFDGSDRKRVGVIAEEVDQRYSVNGNSVSLTSIIFDLVQAVKELAAK